VDRPLSAATQNMDQQKEHNPMSQHPETNRTRGELLETDHDVRRERAQRVANGLDVEDQDARLANLRAALNARDAAAITKKGR
jgi:hypothetical protein